MRLAHIIGTGIAVAAASMVVTIDRNGGALSYPYKGNSPAPNDHGPVTDSTKESKRAKRRRLSKEARS